MVGEGANQRAEKKAKIAQDDEEIIGASHATVDIIEPEGSSVGQCASRAYSDMYSLFETRRSIRGELKIRREEAEAAANEVMKLERSVAKAVGGLAERDWLLTEVQNLKEEQDQLLGVGSAEVA
ncbi:hypothetical protein RHSIM_Rhsim10G0119000 [Rhododendron simsii]|uniref:Uncharacterized protein n=1 Tax=Rhododendron simsii TaxID=118357 RepID=A0A834GEJ6_RHOSS|nr:hypothetical protein RHSIM_Rhsim10G0119000 [Rhododendron simsii]